MIDLKKIPDVIPTQYSVDTGGLHDLIKTVKDELAKGSKFVYSIPYGRYNESHVLVFEYPIKEEPKQSPKLSVYDDHDEDFDIT